MTMTDKELRQHLKERMREMASAIYLANEYNLRVIAQWKEAKLNGKLHKPYKIMSCFNDKIILVNTITLKDEVHRRSFALTCLDFVEKAAGVNEGSIDRREVGQGLCLEVRVHKFLELTFYITCYELPVCQRIEKETIYKSSVYVCTE